MDIVQNQVLNRETITLDDKHFVGCKLIECKLIYDGGEVQLTDSSLERCPIVLSGAALRTANLLAGLGAIPRGGIPLGVAVPNKKPDVQ
ncbi:MAG: hypothetical protein LAO79_19050 [Acidobacteriia bacterium]|nr:hypothetical protein [Terriglobia bacterium]